MVTLRPDIRPDKSLSFDFNLDSEARIRTVRDMEWVDSSADVIKAKLIFSYKHFRINPHLKSEFILLMELGNLKIDFQKGSGINVTDDENADSLPCNLLFFRVTSSEFMLRGTYRAPLELRYWLGDIVVFECVFNHSVALDEEWTAKFQNFRWFLGEKIIPFDIG